MVQTLVLPGQAAGSDTTQPLQGQSEEVHSLHSLLAAGVVHSQNVPPEVEVESEVVPGIVWPSGGLLAPPYLGTGWTCRSNAGWCRPRPRASRCSSSCPAQPSPR